MSLKRISIFAAVLLILLLRGFSASGQNFIDVKGRVLIEIERDGDKQRRPCDRLVTIYGFSSISDAKENLKIAREKIKKNERFSPIAYDTMSDEKGEFEIRLPSNGALLIMPIRYDLDVQYIEVRGRRSVTVVFKMPDEVLVEAVVKPKFKKEPTPRKPKISKDNQLDLGVDYFPIPDEYEKSLGTTDTRLVIQPYVMAYSDSSRVDTLEFHCPVVLDGTDYHNTQIRRKGFDPSRDTLFIVAETYAKKYGSLEKTDSIAWKDYYQMSSPDDIVMAECHIWLEDYNRVLYSKTMKLNDSRRTSRPWRFLEYDRSVCFKLDENDPMYTREPRKVSMQDESKLSLGFAVNSAKVDESDTSSVGQLTRLLETLKSIESPETGGTIKSVKITGVASPDGLFESNKDLARRRMDYVGELIRRAIRKPIKTESNVASWTQLADTLARDSLLTEAEAVRSIVNQFPQNRDAQSARIKKLDFYQDQIVPRLELLRSVKVLTDYDVVRHLTGEEILRKYRKGDKKVNSLHDYEYLGLFKMIDEGHVPDPAEQEEIYRAAIRYTEFDHDNLYWQLPQNRLAALLITQGRTDTTLLHKFIDYGFFRTDAEGEITKWCDLDYYPMDYGKKVRMNPAPVVANQVVMMLQKGYFARAGALVEMLPRKENEDYLKLYYIASCLAGVLDDEDNGSDENKKVEIYNAICATSAKNACIADIAMGHYNKAFERIEQMDQEDPVTHYLLAQCICQEHFAAGCRTYSTISSSADKDRALKALVRSFRMDPKLVFIARTDYDVFEDLVLLAEEEAAKPEVAQEEEVVSDTPVLPEGWVSDGTYYYDELFQPYEFVNGQFINLNTNEPYQP